jgi:osmotically-inducible protein OsmY
MKARLSEITGNLIAGTMRQSSGANNPSVIVSTEVRKRDDRIASLIASTLEWNRLVPHNAINAEVRDGDVILAGYAYTCHDREDAGVLVKQVPGVRDVDNRIEVLKADVLSTQLKAAIVDVLLRHTERICDQISVEVKSGRVVLTGTVRSVAEKRLVLDIVGWTRHVHAVEDRLEIVRDQR